MTALWPNGQTTPGDVWHEFGPRRPIWTPNGYTSSFHSGIDIGPWSETFKTWLLSPVDGEVTHAGYDSIFGNRVVVTCWVGDDRIDFWLCHGRTESMRVSEGDLVSQKQQLQLMGETGKASGIHVHYEIHVNGVRVDPRDFYRSGMAAGGNSTPAILESEEDDDMGYYFYDVTNPNRPYRFFNESRGKSRDITTPEWEARKAIANTSRGVRYDLVPVSANWYDKIVELGTY